MYTILSTKAFRSKRKRERGIKITTMFFQIRGDRFKMSAVNRYNSSGKQSVQTGKWYISIWFGASERQFQFDTKEECDAVLTYLDNVFKVQVI